jgi:putative ABC transport system permease protein
MEIADAIGREGRLAFRALTRSRSFSLIAITTLALGIGATTAIYTLLDAIVLRPLAYRQPEQLVRLDTPVPFVAPDARWGLAKNEFLFFRSEMRSLAQLALYHVNVGAVGARGAGEGPAERVPVVYATASLLPVLGANVMFGRGITEDDMRSSDPTVVVLTHGYWNRHFGGDRRVLGSSLVVDGRPVTIVGVLAPDARIPEEAQVARLTIDLWMPFALPSVIDASGSGMNSHVHQALGRMRPGVTVTAARAEFAQLTARLPEILPKIYSKRMVGFATAITPLRDYVVGSMSRTLWILFGAVALVMLIAAANVANLFLVRAEIRRRDATIRSALGAERVHLVWHALAESLLVATLGGVLAVAVAGAGLRLLVRLTEVDIPRLAEVHLDWRAAAFALGLTIVAGVVLGLLPLLRLTMSTADLGALRDGGRSMTGSRRSRSLRDGLVVAQVSLALVLLASAGLLLRSFRHLHAVRPGFDASGVMTFSVGLPRESYPTEQSVSAFYQQLEQRIAAIPGVVSVGATENLPLTDNDGCSSVVSEASVTRGRPDSPCVLTMRVAPGYFETMRIRVRGRTPDWHANDAREGGIVVSEAIARRLWPGEDAIGKGLRCCNKNPPFDRVIGVADDVRGNGLDKAPIAAVYFPILSDSGAPLGQMGGSPNYVRFVVRTRSGPPEALTPAIRRAVAALDPQLPVADTRAMDAIVAASTTRVSFVMLLLLVAATMALFLSTVGIYGVISYLVAQRRTEIGIRMALGARVSQVSGLVLRQSLRLAVIGIVIGVIASTAATRVLRTLLFDVSPTDPITLGGVAVLLVALSCLAAYGPARRAARVDPVQALRAE